MSKPAIPGNSTTSSAYRIAGFRAVLEQAKGALNALTGQDVSRDNAATAAAESQERRAEQEDVDAYLRARRWRYASAEAAARTITSAP
jgi:hypothetical protein